MKTRYAFAGRCCLYIALLLFSLTALRTDAGAAAKTYTVTFRGGRMGTITTDRIDDRYTYELKNNHLTYQVPCGGAFPKAPAIDTADGYRLKGWNTEFPDTVDVKQDYTARYAVLVHAVSYTIRYTDKNGNPIATPLIRTTEQGVDETVYAPDIAGYTADQDRQTLRVQDKNTVLTFLYTSSAAPEIQEIRQPDQVVQETVTTPSPNQAGSGTNAATAGTGTNTASSETGTGANAAAGAAGGTAAGGTAAGGTTAGGTAASGTAAGGTTAGGQTGAANPTGQTTPSATENTTADGANANTATEEENAQADDGRLPGNTTDQDTAEQNTAGRTPATVTEALPDEDVPLADADQLNPKSTMQPESTGGESDSFEVETTWHPVRIALTIGGAVLLIAVLILVICLLRRRKM